MEMAWSYDPFNMSLCTYSNTTNRECERKRTSYEGFVRNIRIDEYLVLDVISGYGFDIGRISDVSRYLLYHPCLSLTSLYLSIYLYLSL